MFESAHHLQDLSQKSILVTGGAGFIGSNIVAYLLKHHCGKIRVLDNLSTGYLTNLQDYINAGSIEFMDADICKFEDCQKAVKGMDMVCHQAALGSVPRSINNPSATNNVNVGGFVNMLHAASEEGIKRFVYASSSSVYGDDTKFPKVEESVGNCLSPYATSKKTNELYADVFALAYKMEIIGLRYFNVFGPNQSPEGEYAAVIPLFIHSIMKGKPVYIDGDGEQTRDFTFVENAVQANIRALTVENKAAFNTVYNVAVGENFSVNSLYAKLASELKSNQASIHREARAGDVRNSLADISKAKKLLGYNPEFDFNNGLKLTTDYFKGLFE